MHGGIVGVTGVGVGVSAKVGVGGSGVCVEVGEKVAVQVGVKRVIVSTLPSVGEGLKFGPWLVGSISEVRGEQATDKVKIMQKVNNSHASCDVFISVLSAPNVGMCDPAIHARGYFFQPPPMQSPPR